MRTIKIKIKGMECTACENRIKSVLVHIQGVEKVNSNYKTGIIEIILSKDINKNIIKEKIDSLGFTVIGEIL